MERNKKCISWNAVDNIDLLFSDFKQYLVPLRKENPFIESETVFVLQENHIKQYENEYPF